MRVVRRNIDLPDDVETCPRLPMEGKISLIFESGDGRDIYLSGEITDAEYRRETEGEFLEHDTEKRVGRDVGLQSVVLTITVEDMIAFGIKSVEQILAEDMPCSAGSNENRLG